MYVYEDVLHFCMDFVCIDLHDDAEVDTAERVTIFIVRLYAWHFDGSMAGDSYTWRALELLLDGKLMIK